MNTNVNTNYCKLKLSLFFLPLFLLITIVLFLYGQHSLNKCGYVQIQKNSFLLINHFLGQYPHIEYNLTQFGDVLIFVSFLTIFIVYAPKMWESLLSASLISMIFSCTLKNIFSIPRPYEIFEHNSFIMIGRKTIGFASLPSGHSITVFTTLTVLLFAFMPKKLSYKMLWTLSLLIIGLIIVFTRVGVGAHYPLDVIIGSIIGFVSGLTGIFISRKYKIWDWINNKKYLSVFIALLGICCILLISKIINENLVIYYLALISLLISLYKIIYVYAKK